MPKLADRYLLKNITKNDVSIGDLRYKIPAGQTRDLLSKTARLKVKDILTSKHNGSISLRLGKSLIEVSDIIIAKPPSMKETSDNVQFPQRVKSSIVIEVNDISDEIDELSLNEDDEFLKQMEEDNLSFSDESAPLIAKKNVKTKG